MTRLNRERIKLWVDALRSGDYRQTTAVLHRLPAGGDPRPQMCCLGVACDVALKSEMPGLAVFPFNSEIMAYRVDTGYDDSNDLIMPHGVASWYGLEDGNPDLRIPDELFRWVVENRRRTDVVVEASELNDGLGLSFAQIADVIEANFLDRTSTE